jgi:phospholipase C
MRSPMRIAILASKSRAMESLKASGKKTCRLLWRSRAWVLRTTMWLIATAAFAALHAQLVHAQVRDEFNLLTYNVYLRPTTLFANGQMIRAGLLPNELSGYDVIVFQETFDDEARAKLLSGLQREYPYQTAVLGQDTDMEQDGGVAIVSKWPILRQDQRFFAVCHGNDCKSQKGMLYALVNKSGRCYHIIGTHTQADDKRWQIRMQQFQTIKEFITSTHIRSDEPVLIAGDLNEDKFKLHYVEMLERLRAEHPGQTGPTFTFDGPANDLNSTLETKYLDYALYSRDHLSPLVATNEVKVFKSPSPWRQYPWENWYYDLSDHYAVLGSFRFPPALPQLTCPSGGSFRAISISGPTVVKPGDSYSLRANPEGGGPNWAYRWSNGASTESISSVGPPNRDSQRWSLEVTDLRDGTTLKATHRVDAKDPAAVAEDAERREICERRCEEQQNQCFQAEPPEVGCRRAYATCVRRCALQF